MGIENPFRHNTNPYERERNMHESEPEELTVEAVSNPEAIMDQETKRVRWYLNEWKRYKELGYDSVIRLPAGIDPENAGVTDEEIRAAIEQEFSGNQADYEAYARTFQETWEGIQEKMLPIMAQVYGFQPIGHFKIAPTAYGTGGGSLEKDGAIFFRLPKFRPHNPNGKPITEVEAITHEVLCHECTSSLREKTALDDSPIFATHQDVKEVLMDYLGRTLLVRSGLMKREEVRMVGGGDAGDLDFDTLYYADPQSPDENHLRYEWRLPELVQAITEKLKEETVVQK